MAHAVKHAPGEIEQDNILDPGSPQQQAAEAVGALIASRRTIHKFQPEPLPRELLVRAIDVARWAPNHKLTEPWRFYLIGPETADAIATLVGDYVEKKKGPEIASAKRKQWQAVPSMVVATYKKSGDAFREKEDYAATCCAIQNMSLYLWKAGVGMKWSTAGVMETPAFYDLLAIDPDHEEMVGILWCGLPADVPAKSRKPVGAIVRDLP